MNIVVSQDFLPKIGGAHSWLYETYRRWPTPVEVLVAGYAADYRHAEAERAFDEADHGSLRVNREITVPESLDLFTLQCVRSFRQELQCIDRLARGGRVVLHCLRSFPDGFAGALYRRLHPGRARLVTYAHGEEVLIGRTSRQLGMMARQAYAASDLIIANSRNTVRLVNEFFANNKTICIHPGVDPESFQPSAADVAAFRKSWGWSANTVVFSTLARMEPRKNHKMGLQVLRRLRAEGLPVAFVCAGDGENRAELAAATSDFGLAGAVLFPGAISEIQKRLLFAASDIFLMPSIQLGEMIEGFGIVFLEAAAAGTPSVAGDSGGQGEAVLDARTGFVVDGTNEREVADAIRRLVLNPELRRQMGEQGRLWAADNSWGRVAEKTRLAVGRMA